MLQPQCKAGRRVAGVRHRAESALRSCSQILHVSTAPVSLQGPKVLGRVQEEKKNTHRGNAAQGWPCGQAGSLQCETLQTTRQEQGAWGYAALPAQDLLLFPEV